MPPPARRAAARGRSPEAELLVLGADAERLRRLAAGREIVGQLLHRRDRRRVGISGIGHRAPSFGVRAFRGQPLIAHACNRARPAMLAVSARRMRGPRLTGTTKGRRTQGVKLRARRNRPPARPAAPPCRRSGPGGAGPRSTARAPRTAPLGRPLGEQVGETLDRRDARHGQPLGLLGRLGGDRASAWPR